MRVVARPVEGKPCGRCGHRPQEHVAIAHADPGLSSEPLKYNCTVDGCDCHALRFDYTREELGLGPNGEALKVHE